MACGPHECILLLLLLWVARVALLHLEHLGRPKTAFIRRMFIISFKLLGIFFEA